MVQNAVPIQLGWGNTGNDTGTFYNLKIIGDSGRGNDGRAIIVGRRGAYTKTINIYGCSIENPNASWVSLREKDMIVKGEVVDADIRIAKYWSDYQEGQSDMLICGSEEEQVVYSCKP